MARLSRRSLSRSAIAAYFCICVALLLLLAFTVWDSYRDVQMLRTVLLEAAIHQVRSHAERTVGRIERDLELGGAGSLDRLSQDGWLQDHWQRNVVDEARQEYAAVVSNEGEVELHSEPSHTGRRLARHWYNRTLADIGEDVVETPSSAIALSDLAYDIRIPIEVDSQEIGEYHAGFDVEWFERGSKEERTSLLRRRLILIGGVLLIVLLATTSLFYIASHSIALRRTADAASVDRASEVGKLAGGLAHEIRNPLHAIKLNLHTFRRAHEQRTALSDDEVTKLLEQSTREIDRIGQLMQQLVGFASPDEPGDEVIDLTTEIRDVVEFIHQEMLDNKIELLTKLPKQPVRAQIDRGRLRQILLNLMQNAQQAMKDGGTMEVALVRRRGSVVITVADHGPGIPPDDMERIFEPFYTTKSEGTGFGLALVKQYIEQSDGEIHCETNTDGGATFRIILRSASIRHRKP